VCLEPFNLPPRIEPGDQLTLVLRNHANSTTAYAAAIAPADAASDEQATRTDRALVETDPADPGEAAEANFTVPEATHAYAWLTGDDHEARGGHETIPLGVQAGTANEPSTTPAATAIGTLVALIAAIAIARGP